MIIQRPDGKMKLIGDEKKLVSNIDEIRKEIIGKIPILPCSWEQITDDDGNIDEVGWVDDIEVI